MKKLKNYSVWFCAVLLLLSSCSKAQKSMSEKKEMPKDKNVLIVYLSRTKNTKTIADIIHQNVGGTLVELELQNPYPEDYKEIVDQVANENETDFLPPLKTKIEDIEKYEVIFLGFPTWGMQLPPPMKSFLSQNNFKGKTIIPFNTNAGYGIGSSFETVKKLAPDSKILEGFTIKGGIERDGILFVMEGKKKVEAEKKVKEWLTKIGMTK
ncbi:flavodoxin [Chryseobacterium nakagawai]|uniref:Flavodoxin n=1 Tax=Chryseobacterium nakagawai TaxID=1241982 RepID=A0AAD1DSH1_CHRNA|nr:flavodoxin [Chryseobacterium nakagawai]AZA92796.1 flavodoxin [Chryseobacterium nakagawai]VEH19404.1 flavodoxin [Chryseobacterium nakagawai]